MKFEASVTKDYYGKASDNTNSHLNTFITGCTTLAGGVFGFMAIIAVVNFLVSRRDIKSIRKSIEEKVLASFDSEAEKMNELHRDTKTTLSQIEASVKIRTDEILKTANQKASEVGKEHYDKLLLQLEWAKNESIVQTLGILEAYPRALEILVRWGNTLLRNYKPENKERLIMIGKQMQSYAEANKGGALYFAEQVRDLQAFAQALTEVDKDFGLKLQMIFEKI